MRSIRSRCSSASRWSRSRSAAAVAIAAATVPISRPVRWRISAARRSSRSRSAVARRTASSTETRSEASCGEGAAPIGTAGSGAPRGVARSSVSRSDIQGLHDLGYRWAEDHDEERWEDEQDHGEEHLDRRRARLFLRALAPSHAHLLRELAERTGGRQAESVGLDDRVRHAGGLDEGGTPRELPEDETPVATDPQLHDDSAKLYRERALEARDDLSDGRVEAEPRVRGEREQVQGIRQGGEQVAALASADARAGDARDRVAQQAAAGRTEHDGIGTDDREREGPTEDSPGG